MTTCPYCNCSYIEYVWHISHDPPAPDACTAVALALSSTWYPPSMQERGRVNQANVGKRKVSVPASACRDGRRKGIRVRA